MREHKKSHLGIMGWAMFLAGAMSLGSCSSDETLESMEPKAITFGSVSMENHSRAAADPSYGDNKLINGFQVWGTVKGNTNNTVNIFNGANVTRGDKDYGVAWACDETQYWIPNATYNFIAIVDGNKTIKDADNNDVVISSTITATNGMPSSITYNADGSTDLLLGGGLDASDNIVFPKTVTTDATATPNPTGPVAFTMKHLLSKVHFTFQDGSGKPVNTTITNIQVTGHYASGTYTIGDTNPWGTPTKAGENKYLIFGKATNYVDANTPVTSADARLIIPGKQTWSISFNLNGSKQTLELKDQTFEANQAYNLIVTLGKSMTLQVIKVAEWVPVNIVNQYNNSVVAKKMITWVENTFNPEEFSNKHTIQLYNNIPATFEFELSSPMGGTWHAMFLTEQGPSDAFVFVDENGVELGVSCEGMVGKPYKLGVKAKGENRSGEAYLAKLHFVVDMGEYIEAYALTDDIDGLDYTIKQLSY